MADHEQNALSVFIGWDSRESVASSVAAHSIRRRTKESVKISYLNHIELRKQNIFSRPWMIDGKTGAYLDMIDGHPFSTEYSHSRFLVPFLMGYKGWALYMDGDFIYLGDVKQLFAQHNNRFAIMCVQHQYQNPSNTAHLEGKLQRQYYRKNWSSLMLINCGHPAHKQLTPEKISLLSGEEMHRFVWLMDNEIGSLSFDHNYISGISPKIKKTENDKPVLPLSIHYTEGGPWTGKKDVQFADLWTLEYEDWCRDEDHGRHINEMPKTIYDRKDRR